MATLADQVAVVTGASRGIGRAIALRMAAEGASVCLVGRDPRTLQPVADEAGRTGSAARLCRADLTVDEDVAHLVSSLRREVGHVDILVHAAGVIRLGPLETEPVDGLDWHYRTNVRAPYLLTQGLLPLLKSRHGQIVFINSLAGLAAKPGNGQYAATKHALKALADTLREEVRIEGVRVLSVFLGKVATPMQEYVHRAESRPYLPEVLVQPEDVAAVVLSALRLPRTAEVRDVTIQPQDSPA